MRHEASRLQPTAAPEARLAKAQLVLPQSAQWLRISVIALFIASAVALRPSETSTAAEAHGPDDAGAEAVAATDTSENSNTLEAVAERLRSDLTYLASDELEGRGIGTEGIAKAGDFIAARFSELGLSTDSFDGSPFQNFKLPGPSELAPGDANRLQFAGNAIPEPITLQLGRDFNTLTLGSSGEFTGQVLFAGYGITAEEYGYDDYAGVDARGKVVIAIRKEPQQNDPDSRFAGTQNSQYAFFTTKELNAALHEVAALILINDAGTVAAAQERLANDLAAAEKSLVELEAAPMPADAEEQRRQESRVRGARQQVDALRLRIEEGAADMLLSINEAGAALTDKRVPTLFMTRAKADQLLRAGLNKSLEELEQAIDHTGQPQSAVLEGITASGSTEFHTSDIDVRNVIGVLPGSGSLAEEYVVVGAHYDHVGMGGRGSLAPGTIAVHNGADDNGSGTVAMLEIARQLAERNPDDRRTLLFMAFTAEESGLLGSIHYVRNPRFPLEKTVAMINLDMVGRLVLNELTVYGTGTAAEFGGQIDRLGAEHQFRIVKVPQGRGASDHASFYDAKIPVLHFFTGLHNEYHRPSDDVELIQFDGMARIAQLVTQLAAELSETAARPQLLEIAGSAAPRTQPNTAPRGSGNRVVLGVQLSGEPTEPAVLVSVREDGPAAKAGMQAGDRVTRLGEAAINTTAELREVIAGLKRDTKVQATVTRGAEEIQLELDLSQ
jgi:hypothetical protein